MKPASAALIALLASGTFLSADLYTFTLAGGQVLRYTSLDTDVIANGHTFSSGGVGGPFFDRQDNKAKTHWKIGVETDTLVFDVLPGNAAVLGVPWLPAIRYGAFDGAELQLERTYAQTPVKGLSPPLVSAVGTIILFAGRVAEIDFGRGIATYTINSHLELLNLQLPRNLYQHGCVNSLYDTACGVSRAAFAVNTTVSSWQPATGTIATAYHAQPSGYFGQGSIIFTSGQNAGWSRTIKSSSSDQASFTNILPLAPFPFAPAPGDAFTLQPGCDKSLGANGCPKFNNVSRFKGFPFIPVPETAV